MRHRRVVIVAALVTVGCAGMVIAGDIVVDGKVVSHGAGFQFPDGSIQDSSSYPKWQQVAIVDINGRGDYTDPVDAMTDLASWCPSPSASTPCLVKILPGTYSIGTETLPMEPHVEIEGSGREVTRITASSAIAVTAADQSELRWLTVVNESALAMMTGVSITGADFRLHDVAVELVNTSPTGNSYGISASDATVMADSIDVFVNGGAQAYGVTIENACLGRLRHANVSVSAASYVVGMDFDGTSGPAILGSEVSVLGPGTAEGIHVHGLDLFARNMRISVEAAGSGYGYGITTSGTGTVDFSGGWIRVEAGSTGTGLWAWDGLIVARESQINAKSTGDKSYGARTDNSGGLFLERVTVTGEGGTHGYGVYLDSSGGAKLTGVIANAFGGTTYNYGLHSRNTVPFDLERCTLTASDGSGSWGVLNDGAVGVGGTIDHSTISGGTKAVRNDNSSNIVYVGNSRLDGGVTSNLTCFGNYDNTYAAVTCP